MANRGYLCAHRSRALYPSVREPGYDPSQHTVAASVAVVPVLWLAGFSSDDVVIDDVTPARGAPVRVVGMVTERARFLSRLSDDAPRLARTLHAPSDALAAHARLLAAAVEGTDGDFVSTELEEIAALRRGGPESFLAELRAAIDGDFAALLAVSGWERGAAIPRADSILGEEEPGDADAMALARLLGHSHVRDVPWERALPPEPVDPPLVLAVRARDADTVRALLAAGVDVNAAGPRGSTALRVAVNSAESLALLLLDAGATITPAAFADAARRGRPALVQRMLALGADPRMVHEGESVLTRACQALSDAEPIARMLLDAGADPDAGTRPPLIAALASKREPLVRLLLERGARLDAVDHAGHDVLWWARASKRPALLALVEARL